MRKFRYIEKGHGKNSLTYHEYYELIDDFDIDLHEYYAIIALTEVEFKKLFPAEYKKKNPFKKP